MCLGGSLDKPRYAVDDWRAYTYVKMTTSARLSHAGERTSISIPLTEVSEVLIFDDGQFCWHSDANTPENNLDVIRKLATAVSEGRLPSGHHYEMNRNLYRGNSAPVK